MRLFKSPNNAVSNRALEVKSSIFLSRSDPQSPSPPLAQLYFQKGCFTTTREIISLFVVTLALGSRHELEEARDRNLGSSVSG